MTKLSSLLLALVTALPVATATAEPAPEAYGACVACHGAAGEGNLALQAPALAGQDAAYLERQLVNYKKKIRGGDPKDTLGMQMAPMAAALADDAIPVVSGWLAAQPRPQVIPSHEGDLKNGNDYYHSKCDACHGAWGEGNARLNAPAIAWLDADYLKRQYANFDSGVRGSHPEDTYGRQMQLMSDVLPQDSYLDDIIAYMQARAAAEQ